MPFRFILRFIIGTLILYSCNQNRQTPLTSSSAPDIEKSYLDSFTLDKIQSIIYWQGFSPVGNHNGSLKFLKGTLYSINKILQAGELTIDIQTISALDLQEPSDKLDLEGHLKSADFFFADSFPVAQFRMSSITMIKDTLFNAIVHGFLTLKDVTKPLKVKCKVDHTDDLITVTIPEFTIDRTEYNIMYQSKKLINAPKVDFINDEISLSIKLVAKKI